MAFDRPVGVALFGLETREVPLFVPTSEFVTARGGQGLEATSRLVPGVESFLEVTGLLDECSKGEGAGEDAGGERSVRGD